MFIRFSGESLKLRNSSFLVRDFSGRPEQKWRAILRQSREHQEQGDLQAMKLLFENRVDVIANRHRRSRPTRRGSRCPTPDKRGGHREAAKREPAKQAAPKVK